MDTSTARLFAQYRAWADRLTYEAVAALPPGEAEKERPTLFKTIIGTLNHNYLIDRVWQAHIEGRDHGFRARNLILHAELPALWDAQQAMNRWWSEWSAAQSSTSLPERVHFRFIGGEEGAMTRGAILLHVVNHATYHRGWVADMFFQVPAKNQRPTCRYSWARRGKVEPSNRFRDHAKLRLTERTNHEQLPCTKFLRNPANLKRRLFMSLVHRCLPFLVALALVGPVSALAQTSEPPQLRRDWADRYMVRLAPDGKGYATLDDALRYAGAQFDRFDRSHTGVLDMASFTAAQRASLERASEARKPYAQRTLDRREALFRTLDAKGEGKITKEAYLAMARQHFTDIDVKQAGKITAADLRLAHHGV